MRRLIVAAAAALLIGISVPMQAANAATKIYDYNESYPVSYQTYMPCVNEFVSLEGRIHATYKTSVDDKGGFTSKWHSNPQGVSGVGLTSGDRYNSTGASNGSFSGKADGSYSNAFRSDFHLVGAGGNQFRMQWAFRVAVDPDGTVHVKTDSFEMTCK